MVNFSTVSPPPDDPCLSDSTPPFQIAVSGLATLDLGLVIFSSIRIFARPINTCTMVLGIVHLLAAIVCLFSIYFFVCTKRDSKGWNIYLIYLVSPLLPIY